MNPLPFFSFFSRHQQSAFLVSNGHIDMFSYSQQIDPEAGNSNVNGRLVFS